MARKTAGRKTASSHTHATPTPEQNKIITADANEDILVVAGAGSGKTFTMTERIIWLITHEGVPAEKILGLTFTRKAAGELLTRVTQAVNEEAASRFTTNPDARFLKPHVATYDAFFQSIVRQYGPLIGMNPKTAPLSDAGARQLVSDVVGRNLEKIRADELSDTDNASGAGAFSSLVDDVKKLSDNIANFMIGKDCLSVTAAIERIRQWDRKFIKQLDDIRATDLKVERVHGVEAPELKKKATDNECYAQLLNYLEDGAERREILLTLVEEYDKTKRDTGMAEYSDFTIAAYQLVSSHPAIGAEYRRRYTHVFLDEYQDTSTTQAMLLALIFHRDENHRSPTTAVGDPRQAIYGWRGASPDAFELFAKNFHTKNKKTLTQSRRNPSAILTAANHLAAVGMQKKSASDVSLRPLDDRIGELALAGFRHRDQAAAAVAAFARRAKERYGEDCRGKAPVAVLFRSKTHMDAYREALEAEGLRCQVVGKNALLNRPDIVDIVSVLDIVSDHTNYVALQHLMLSPRFGVDIQDARAFSAMADLRNARYQHRVLETAGRVEKRKRPQLRHATDEKEKEEKTREWNRCLLDDVRPYRDDIPVAVTLVDVLLSGSLDNLRNALATAHISPAGQDRLIALARALRAVEAETNGSLEDTIRTVARILNIDADSAVSAAVHGTKSPSTDDVNQLVSLAHSYEQELPAGLHATIRGFVSWLSAFSTIPDGPATTCDDNVDAVLMTIHQAKGLEWHAVAVVDMTNGTFPSKEGDRLKVIAPRDTSAASQDISTSIYASPDGVEYHSTCDCWLDHACEVPPAVRVDSAALPAFPPKENVEDMQNTARMKHECSDAQNRVNSAKNSADMFISQREAYGRRLFDDERHLAYVALTRAQDEALLVFDCKDMKDEKTLDLFGTAKDGSTKISPFWLECYGYMSATSNYALLAAETGCVIAASKDQREDTMRLLKKAADNVSAEQSETRGEWPQKPEKKIRDVLTRSAGDVENAPKIQKIPGVVQGSADLLLASTRRLVNTAQADAAEAGNIVALANQVKRHRPSSPSGIEKTVENQSKSRGQITGQARSILRPMPQQPFVSDEKIAMGNAFHAWVKRYLDAQIGTTEIDYREEMREDLERDGMDPKVKEWCTRFINSTWVKRDDENGDDENKACAAEMDLSAWVGGQIVSGTMDAVFYGSLPPEAREGLDEAGRDDDGRGMKYTIVDWKTGEKPEEKDVDLRLIQVDVYRLMLAKRLGVPLESIDATLYYIDKEKEEDRFVVAKRRTADEIIQDIVDNLYLPEDNDRE